MLLHPGGFTARIFPTKYRLLKLTLRAVYLQRAVRSLSHSQCRIKFLVILDLNGVWQILVFHCPFIFPLPKPSAQHDKQKRKQQQQSPEDPDVDVELSHCNTCTDTHISSHWMAGFKLQINVYSVLELSFHTPTTNLLQTFCRD